MNNLIRHTPRHFKRLFSTISVVHSNNTNHVELNPNQTILKKNLDDLLRRSRQYEKNLSGISYTQNIIQEELAKEQARLSISELKELLYLSKTDYDIDILAKAINRYLMDNKIQWSELDHHNDLARIFIELLYFLKKNQKALDLFHDPTYNRLFRSHRVQETFLLQLIEANMFDEFIKVLKKQLTRYYKRVYSNPGEQNKQPGNEQAPQTLIRSGDPLVIPISHMELITRFFLQQNTLQSYNAYKDLILRVEKSGVEVSTFFKLRLIVLAILQEQGSAAYEMMRGGIFEKDKILNNNLRLIINSKLNRTEDCLKRLKNMFFHENPIYPFTLKMIRLDLEKQKDNEEYTNQMDIYYKRAYLESRIFDGPDLFDIVNGSPILKKEFIITTTDNVQSDHDKGLSGRQGDDGKRVDEEHTQPNAGVEAEERSRQQQQQQQQQLKYRGEQNNRQPKTHKQSIAV